MCEFCVQHGEGEKWYLRAENYAEDMLSDLRRQRIIVDFLGDPSYLAGELAKLRALARAPAPVQRMVKRVGSNRMKKDHFGQVLPLEDIEQILGFVNSVVRLPCVCRQATLGQEHRYCYGFSLGPNGGAMAELLRSLDSSVLNGPDTAGLEPLTHEETLGALAEHEKEGLCHTIWSFRAPFIGGVCNCNQSDCVAMRATVGHGLKVMFRAEYVATSDADACTGCRACLKVCQFGALVEHADEKKVRVDQTACYGCGICRSVCKKGAIRLVPRSEVPAVASVW